MIFDRNRINAMTARIPALEAEMAQPGTASNMKRYRELVRDHGSLSNLRDTADVYFRLQQEIGDSKEIAQNNAAEPDLRELASAEIADLEKQLVAAEKKLIEALAPPDPAAVRNAILEIRAGTGGAEAALFAGDLFRMYNRFAESRKLKINVIDASVGEAGGYKEIISTVEGNGAYGILQYESGGHRVQRVPATEAQGRIHTSAATVAVFPETDPDDDIQISPDEIRIDIFCSSGPGGQSVNTTYSAVRITHLPSGIVVQSQDERSQHRNKDKAMSVLKARLLDARKREEAAKKGEFRRMMIGSGDRSERIRTYNFPQNRLTDHRINLTLYSLDRIIEGNLDELISALHHHDVQMRVEKETQPSQPQT